MEQNKQAGRDREIVRIVETYSDMLMRIALNRVNSIAEAEDVVQSTFERLLKRQPRFESREHEKAWLIRTEIRICIDEARKASRTNVSLNEEIAAAYSEESFELLDTIRQLPRTGPRRRVSLLLRGIHGQGRRKDPRRTRGNDTVETFPRKKKAQGNDGRRRL